MYFNQSISRILYDVRVQRDSGITDWHIVVIRRERWVLNLIIDSILDLNPEPWSTGFVRLPIEKIVNTRMRSVQFGLSFSPTSKIPISVILET